MTIHLTSAYHAVDKLRRKKRVELRDRLKHEHESHFPFRLLTLSLIGLDVLEAILRFLIILTHDSKKSFELFYRSKDADTYSNTFDGFKKVQARVRVFTLSGAMVIVVSSALVGLALNFATGVYRTALAASFGWTQTNWSTLTSNTTGHPAPANWTEYSATTTSITGGATLSLATVAASSTQTTDTDFSAGTNSNTAVSGSGTGATVVLGGSYTPMTPQIVGTYAVSSSYLGIAFDSSTNSIWVTNYAGNTVTKLSAATGALVGTYAVGGTPVGATFDPFTNSIWVTNNGGNTVTKLSATTGALVGTYGVGTSPQGATFDPSTNSIWVANNSTNDVTKLSAATGALVGTYAVGTGPRAIAFDSSTNSIWVANYGASSTVTKLSAATGALVGTYAVGTGPRAIVFDSSTNSIWVANNSTNNVTKLSAATGALVGTYAVGTGPYGVVFDSPTNSIWVANSSTNNVTKLSAATGALVGTYGVDAGPTAITFDSSTNSIWVANQGSSTVNKITVASWAYTTSGTFTSSVIDTGGNQGLTTISYTASTSASTSFSVDVRAGNTATPDGTWSAWQTNVASGGSVSNLGANRYVQYRANLGTTDTAVTPMLRDMTINYNRYPSAQTLTSSKFDTGNTANLMGSVVWNEDATLPSGTSVAVSLRASSTATTLVTTNWATLTSTSTGCSKSGTTVTCLSSALPSSMRDGANDQWFQYMVTLSSTGASTPSLADVTINYVINLAPELQNVTASEQTGGTVLLSYDTRDPDSTSGSFTPGSVAPSFEYSTDGGSTWTPIVSNLSASATTSKSVSETNWTTYSATWTAKNVLNGIFSTTTKIRVTVNDGELASNTAQLATLGFTLDEKDPVMGAVPLQVQATYNPALITLSVTDDSAIQMKIGRMPDLSDATWVPYTSSTTRTLVAEPDTIYAQFKDAYSNTSLVQAVSTPTTPTSMIFRDLSNAGAPPVYRLFVSWSVVPVPGPGFGSYRVYRSTDGISYSLYSTIADRLQNYLLDDNGGGTLNNNTTYYYKVYVDDVNGDTSYYSAVVSDIPDGQGGTDTTPPSITGVSSTTTPQTATINWTTDELSDSTVGYCLSPCTDYSTTQGVGSFVANHEVILTGLTPGQTYNYSVTSRDPSSNTASSTGLSFTTRPGPSISGVAVTRASNTSADVAWSTDVLASAYVGYATNTPPSGGVESIAGLAMLTLTRTVTLSGLVPGTKYYFYVKSQDAGGNWAEDKNAVNGVNNYYQFKTSNDITPPVISSVATSTVTDIAAAVSWITDEIADSTVEWGTSTGVYASSTTRTTYDITHFLELDGLSPSTRYYYHVISADQGGNSATSSEYTFTTLEEQFGASERIVQQIVYTSHRDPDGVSQVLYDAALKEIQNLKDELAKKSDDLATALGKLNEIKTEVLGLKEDETTDPKALLQIVATKFSSLTKIFEKDASLDLSESDLAPAAQTLRDLAEAVPPPVIKGAPQIDIAPDRVTISWSSDKETNSVIALARKAAYDPSKENPYTQEYGSTDVYTKEHKVALENLLPSTEYHFQIRSTSQLGSKVKTRDFTFNTPVQLPEISDARILQMENGKVQLSWHTNVLTNAAVRYTPFEMGKPVPANAATFGKSDYVNDHIVVLEQLKSGTTYGIELLSTDPYGNTAKREMENYTTGKDVAPPEISQVRTDITIFPGSGNKIQAIVFWKTNELATSQVFYEEGVATQPESKPKEFTAQTIDMTTNHTVVIANWKASTVYRFRVVSMDASGNIAESKDFTIKTPQKKASIIDVIVNNFSTTFSWTKNVGL